MSTIVMGVDILMPEDKQGLDENCLRPALAMLRNNWERSGRTHSPVETRETTIRKGREVLSINWSE